MSKIGGKIKEMIRNWLEIQPSIGDSILIQEVNTFAGTCFRNELWYRGDASELHQYYTQVDDLMNNTKFWAAESTTGVDFRKIHTGLPALIVDMLADIIIDALNKVELTNSEDAQKVWEKIEEENGFKDVVKQAIIDVFVDGDGAFKFSYDPEISQYPIVEFFAGNNVEYEYKRGRIIAVIFKTRYKKPKGNYLLCERYSKDGITYKLYLNNKEVPLNEIDETKGLLEITDNTFMMAIPMMFNKSKKFKGRGQSIFEKKIDDFDSLDEVWSQWIEALRDNRTQTYIPEDLIPQDENGNLLKPNTWDKRYVRVNSTTSEDNSDKVIRVTGDFDYEKMLQGYITALDLCLQGLISPSTLGIDTKKLDNADAQREKEKVTQYTRNKVIRVLEKILPVLATTGIKIYDKVNQKASDVEYEAKADFGEYSSPSFEAVVETVSKARPGQNVISVERTVEELWGDNLSKKEKEEEVRRLKEEAGIIQKEEPNIMSPLE